MTTICLVLLIHGVVAHAQATTAPGESTVTSRDGFRARVADRELRAAFRGQHRVAVREEVPGASASPVNDGEHVHISPDLSHRRILMIAVPVIFVAGIVALKWSRRGKSVR